MNTNENAVANEELLAKNSDFLKAVVGAKTVEEAQDICAEYRVELPQDVWNGIQDSCRGGESGSGELSEDALSDVCGGTFNGENFLKTVGGIVGLGATVAAGSAAGVLVACAWVGYYGYKTFR